MNPYQPGEDNQDPYMVGYKAGAASRDAEIAELVAALEYIAVDDCGCGFPCDCYSWYTLAEKAKSALAKVRKP